MKTDKLYVFYRNIFVLLNQRFSTKNVSVLLIDPSCKDGNVRFTIHLLSFVCQVWIIYLCFCFLKLLIFVCRIFAKVTGTLLFKGSNGRSQNYGCIFHSLIRLRFQWCRCKLVNRVLSSLHGGSLKITLTVPLVTMFIGSIFF